MSCYAMLSGADAEQDLYSMIREKKEMLAPRRPKEIQRAPKVEKGAAHDVGRSVLNGETHAALPLDAELELETRSFMSPGPSIFHDPDTLRSPWQLKAQVRGHPKFPSILDMHLQINKECVQLASSSMLSVELDEIMTNIDEQVPVIQVCEFIDPELDQFMDDYFAMLVRLKVELKTSIDQVRSYTDEVEQELRQIFRDGGCFSNGNYGNDDCFRNGNNGDEEDTQATPDIAAHHTFEEGPEAGIDCGHDASNADYEDGRGIPTQNLKYLFKHGDPTVKVDPNADDEEMKRQLIKKYGCTKLKELRNKLRVKRKHTKLPCEATEILLDWWSQHLNFPYPNDLEKQQLLQATRLDTSQISNWFINQRKRHWVAPLGFIHPRYRIAPRLSHQSAAANAECSSAATAAISAQPHHPTTEMLLTDDEDDDEDDDAFAADFSDDFRASFEQSTKLEKFRCV